MWTEILSALKSIRNLKVVLFAYSGLYLLYLKVPYVEGVFNSISPQYKTYFEIGGLFVLLLSVCLTTESIYKLLQSQLAKLNRPKVFKTLTSSEKKILRAFVVEGKRTENFRYSSGEVNHLVALNILYRASTLAKMGDIFAYNIHSWALEYLSENPHLLDE